MHTSAHAILLAGGLLAAAVPAHAQDEAALKAFFEGKTVVVKVDMPATSAGVDVFPDARSPMDFDAYSQRLKTTGVALHAGESAMVTKVHVKDKLIEFQLAGGGFGTFGDDTSTTVYVAPVPKSRREKDLEREVKEETDRDRRRRLQRELDDLREHREREDARRQADARVAEEAKKARVADQRLHGGSRFNIRYNEGVPPGLEPAGVMRALADYVEFPFAGDRRLPPPPTMEPPPLAPGPLAKGMSMADVEAALGRPESSSQRMEGSLKVISAVYTRGDQRITAEFVEGVLVRYSITSR